ncbi:MAG: AAA family ATPase, partial [Chitinivibrionales bacterium]|nr:AAA family ATPase [Chitinivibrionales bacterium]
MLVQRALATSILDLATKYPVVTITGPRQSGKTTLAKTVFSDHTYVSLEEPDMREFARTDPRGFLATYPAGSIIDEVQQAPDLLSYLQTLVDESRDVGQYVLTGSQHFSLAERISQSLAGRTAVCTLLPFSIAELRGAAMLPDDLD